MKNRLLTWMMAMLVLSTTILALRSYLFLPPSAVIVFAGNDTYTCPHQNLILSNLGATISGDGVTNGDWITLGDGRFMPSNSLIGRFNSATTYVPGPNDRSLGYYRLLLIADPSSINPNERVQDEVKITFSTIPPIVCSNNTSISLNETCMQKVEVQMLIPNPQQPLSLYTLTLYNKDGSPILNNTVTRAHLDQEISYKLGHQCTSNTCWGKLTVKDYYPPLFYCDNDTIECVKSIDPDSLGWPFPATAFVDTIVDGNFIVKGWDACGDVTLSYEDFVIPGGCNTPVDRRIKRTWTASDASGNEGYCEEWIVINRTNINTLVFPGHFDGVDHPGFMCHDTFPHLVNGHPSPDTTGYPLIGSCSHLQYNYTDIPFVICGNSYKVVRSWFVIDWCANISRSANQFIHVLDKQAPTVSCLDTLILYTSIYDCEIDRTLVPIPYYTDNCNNANHTVQLRDNSGKVLGPNLSFVGQQFYIQDLTVGTYSLHYNVADICGNIAQCSTVVVVIDNIEPHVSCDELTKVSLLDNGTARVFAASFDQHSFDNCKIASFKVRRMETACGIVPAWGDYAMFCCDDVGIERQIALEVTDIYGNKNTCMVNVLTDEKLKPTITCPPHLTIECSHSYDIQDLHEFGSVQTDPLLRRNVVILNAYHNGTVGIDGLAQDNCFVKLDSSFVENVSCFLGTIDRSWTATDKSGNTATCKQTITIKNPDPFDANDINWPVHYTGNGCMEEDLLPDVTGMPTYSNTDCATVSASYDDQYFYIAEGACLKIIRTWTVIDWCQFKQVGDPGKFGPYVQTIKIHNTDAPSFVSSCADTMICNYAAQCGPTKVVIKKIAHDGCTADDKLEWKWKLDIDNNGSFDATGLTSIMDVNLVNGRHKVIFEVNDQCGNLATCTQFIDVKDCKPPTPYCLGSLSVSIDQVSEGIAVWARDFDLGATDNCSQDLLFTFDGTQPVSSMLNKRHFFTGNGVMSDTLAYAQGDAQVWIPATRSSGMFFDCGDIADGKIDTIPLAISVIDAAGNMDSCSVSLILTDNDNICTDLVNDAVLSGRIATTNGVILSETQVYGFSGEWNQTTEADPLTGNYAINKAPIGQAVELAPRKITGVIDGVSTLDLILIQRHILNLAPITSPYKLIAADVNQSSTISALDLVELRKIILGIYAAFPKDADPWTFVPSDFVFVNPAQPFFYDKQMIIDVQGDQSGLDFIAIKRGDVNDSAKGNEANTPVEYRIKPIDLTMDYQNNDAQIYATAITNLDGLQVVFDNVTTDIIEVKSDFFDFIDANVINGQLRIIATNEKPKYYNGEESLFVVSMDKIPTHLSFNLGSSSEIYIDEVPNPIQLLAKDDDKLRANEIKFALSRNPVSTQIDIEALILEKGSSVEIFVSDVLGRRVHDFGTIYIYSRDELITLPIPTDMASGYYHLGISIHGRPAQTLPIVVIK